jgi:hypothetical protein
MKKVLNCIAELCLLSPTLGLTKTWDFDVFMDGKESILVKDLSVSAQHFKIDTKNLN